MFIDLIFTYVLKFPNKKFITFQIKLLLKNIGVLKKPNYLTF